ncbi:MAG: glycerate kinase [Pseudomonadota bacterium]
MSDSSAARALLLHLFEAALAASDAGALLARHLPAPPRGRTIVIGAGKAAARMAQALEQHWTAPLQGLVVTRYGHGAPTRSIEVIEAGHPVPDAASAEAATRMLAQVRGLTADDLVLCLMSGGGSALLSLPLPGLALAEKQAIHRALLRCGAPIGAINCVRRHLSAIKGGRLALACHPARVLTLVVSDVPGDDPAVVASGPTVADGTTARDALAILHKYGIAISAQAQAVLCDPALAAPAPDDVRLARNSVAVIATAQGALDAAAAAARAAGYATLVLGSDLEGEARVVAREHAALALRALAATPTPTLQQPDGAPPSPWQQDDPRQTAPARPVADTLAPPCVILSGGETSVTMRGQGRGGRNTEFLLALAIALDGAPGVHAIACDTDGIDGSEDNAGAIIGPGSLARAAQAGLYPAALLDDNDAYGFFAALGDLVVTGPTRTNVNDFRAIVIERPTAPLTQQ